MSWIKLQEWKKKNKEYNTVSEAFQSAKGHLGKGDWEYMSGSLKLRGNFGGTIPVAQQLLLADISPARLHKACGPAAFWQGGGGSLIQTH